METEGSVHCSQQPATGFWPTTDKASPHSHTISLRILIWPFHLWLVLPSVLFLSVTSTKSFYPFISSMHTAFFHPHHPSWVDHPNKMEQDIFSQKTCRPALGPTQPPIQWLLGVKWEMCVMLTSHLQLLVFRLRMGGDISILPLYAFMLCTGTILPS